MHIPEKKKAKYQGAKHPTQEIRKRTANHNQIHSNEENNKDE